MSTLGELQTRPDSIGLRLIEGVYEAFGYFPEDLPQEFDRTRGVLEFPT
jgi:hypothetical protein